MRSAAERRWHKLNEFNHFYRKANARIWPRLSYIFNNRSNAVNGWVPHARTHYLTAQASVLRTHSSEPEQGRRGCKHDKRGAPATHNPTTSQTRDLWSIRCMYLYLIEQEHAHQRWGRSRGGGGRRSEHVGRQMQQAV